ncbi:hypothetical protein E2562_011009 [Oryza meyeriana var. granulata]|uniref:3-hydroxyisobutyrate dehydrogenase-like NAD-binding domain-containing protein n=1 Tax=Oryza meyeriana var. granulata TaxID=110450 RepID=A0A6G1BV09_9ORYZ|nr:hypothetical protein E2562_011009 [Oryza meyeriana var. granulata]
MSGAVPRCGVQGCNGLHVMDIFSERMVSREFASGGTVKYIIKDLGMALETEEGLEGAKALPGAAMFRQMFSAMAANGDGDLGLQGLITIVEHLNGIRK